MPESGNTGPQLPSAGAANLGDFDSFLARLGARDRLNVDRHLAACEAEGNPAHQQLWKHMVCCLFRLASHAVQTIGQQAVQFFIADGKYRMQVFAMEDQRDGKIHLYATDVIADAMKLGIVGRPRHQGDEVPSYGIPAQPNESLIIESLDAANTPNPAAWYKNMLGWNRRAMRITLHNNATPAQVEVAEKLCELAAKQWAPA